MLLHQITRFAATQLTSVIGVAVVVALAGAVSSVPAMAQAGVCRSTNCSSSPPSCDPDAWARYERKRDVSGDIFDFAQEREKASDEAFGEGLKDLLGENAQSTGNDLGLEVDYDRVAASYTARTAREEGEVAAKYAAAHNAESVEWISGWVSIVGWAELAADVYKFETIYRQWMKDGKDNEAIYAKAQEQWKKALADFVKAGVKSPECKADRAKADADQKLLDKANALIEEWTQNDVSYRDPHTGVVYDAGGALTRALQIVQGQQSGMVAPQLVFRFAAYDHEPSSDSVMVTLQQLTAAMVQMDIAAKAFGVTTTAVRASIQQEQRLVAGMPPIIAAMHAGPGPTAQTGGAVASSSATSKASGAAAAAKDAGHAAAAEAKQAAQDAAKRAIHKLFGRP